MTVVVMFWITVLAGRRDISVTVRKSVLAANVEVLTGSVKLLPGIVYVTNCVLAKRVVVNVAEIVRVSADCVILQSMDAGAVVVTCFVKVSRIDSILADCTVFVT